eukprot:GHVT01089845.1.p1 GENE.GHVT01089845.1~~GHVT01089845.1.p1  ORF type:complete len:135 (-),score=17.18 GHVT01089845.1:668-1072(-)
MGRKGSAITIVSPEERLKAKQIIREANGLAQGTGGKRGRAEEGGGAGTAANAIKLSKVNPQELQEWKQKFFAQKHSIAKYLTAERREKMMRLADIELSKAENLITYKGTAFVTSQCQHIGKEMSFWLFALLRAH